ncbi:MAG: alpha/beta hydrolase [Alphaproteobacteria bacterium]|nr:alpha/beta hydrolase [Alphaproteobacteria bacterium]
MEIAVNDRRVYAHTGGRPFDPAQPALVLVHGAGMDHTVWSLQTRYFAHHGRSVLAVDLPGHGRSEGPPLASVEAVADWIAELVAAAGCERAALAGHSLGALASLECAARHPERVRALALLGCTAAMPVHPDLLNAAQTGDHLAMDLVTDWGFGRPAHVGGHRAPGMWMTGGGLRLLEEGPSGVLGVDMAAANAYQGGLEAARAVPCPTLLIGGAEDRMTPVKAGRKLAEAIAGAEMVVLPRAGHMMMVEAPDATLDAMDGFL